MMQNYGDEEIRIMATIAATDQYFTQRPVLLRIASFYDYSRHSADIAQASVQSNTTLGRDQYIYVALQMKLVPEDFLR